MIGSQRALLYVLYCIWYVMKKDVDVTCYLYIIQWGLLKNNFLLYLVVVRSQLHKPYYIFVSSATTSDVASRCSCTVAIQENCVVQLGIMVALLTWNKTKMGETFKHFQCTYPNYTERCLLTLSDVTLNYKSRCRYELWEHEGTFKLEL